MKVGIMQPYFFPYIGYWQLINAVDKFIIYDNIQFTKRGWIRRNRILMNDKDKMISLPLKKDSNYLNVNERYLADNFGNERKKIKNQIKTAYQKAPEFETVFPIIEKVLDYEKTNLFDFLYNSILFVLNYLEIDTGIIVSSHINIDHSLKNKYKVIAICNALKARMYINPIGGTELYDKKEFDSGGIKLQFIKTDSIKYNQFNSPFIPSLSIIDVMMFNSKDAIRDMLNKYVLV